MPAESNHDSLAIDYRHAKECQHPSACSTMPQPDDGTGIDECAGLMKSGRHDNHQITGQMPYGGVATKDE
jgi:hypothetical protein